MIASQVGKQRTRCARLFQGVIHGVLWSFWTISCYLLSWTKRAMYFSPVEALFCDGEVLKPYDRARHSVSRWDRGFSFQPAGGRSGALWLEYGSSQVILEVERPKLH